MNFRQQAPTVPTTRRSRSFLATDVSPSPLVFARLSRLPSIVRILFASVLSAALLVLGLSSAAMADGASWTITLADTEENQWHDVAYGNGVWIAVSGNGTNRIMRSTDNGLTWNAIAAPQANEWRSIATNGSGTWIGVSMDGADRTMRSTDDGANWTAIDPTLGMDQYMSIAYGNSVWVAVTKNGATRSMRSTNNGTSWTGVNTPSNEDWNDVAYGNGVWIGVAETGGLRIMRSTDDGSSWVPFPAPEANAWESSAYGNGVWVSVSSNGTNRVMRSTDDGLSWDPVTVTEGAWKGVAFGNGAFVAVSSQGANRVMYSGGGSSGSSSSGAASAPTTVDISIDLEGLELPDGWNPTVELGDWIRLPAASEIVATESNAGKTLLGYATTSNFPVAIAQRQIDNGWGPYEIRDAEGRLSSIFIPAGQPILISAAPTLHPIWAD